MRAGCHLSSIYLWVSTRNCVPDFDICVRSQMKATFLEPIWVPCSHTVTLRGEWRGVGTGDSTRCVSELEVNYPDMLDSAFDRSRGFMSHINLEKSPQKTFIIFKAGHSGSDFFITRVASCSEDEASERRLLNSIPAKSRLLHLRRCWLVRSYSNQLKKIKWELFRTDFGVLNLQRFCCLTRIN